MLAIYLIGVAQCAALVAILYWQRAITTADMFVLLLLSLTWVVWLTLGVLAALVGPESVTPALLKIEGFFPKD